MQIAEARYRALMHGDQAKLTSEEIEAGWHFCPDWDYMLVGPGMGELSSCYCPRSIKLPQEVVFAVTDDGRFYRGSRFWRWTRSWRRAAALGRDQWKSLQGMELVPAGLRLVTLAQAVEIMESR